MNEERGDFVRVVEDETVAPRDDGAGERSMRKTVTCDEQGRTRRKDPDIDKVEDCAVVAEVEEEIMPCTFLVGVCTDWQEVAGKNGVCDMYPSAAGRMNAYLIDGMF